MFRLCMSFTKRTISEVRAKTKSLVSLNFCVRSVLCLNFIGEFRLLDCWTFHKLLFFFHWVSANTGGLLSLFMGFSVFSIIEIFYFLTFRPCIHHMKVSKKRRQVMKRMVRRSQSNRGRIPKSLLHSRVHREVPENNSVYPYIN